MAIAVVIAAHVATAHAQPAAGDAAPEAGGGYADDLSARPLLLPSGVFEADLQLSTVIYTGNVGIDAFDYMFAGLFVRAGLGPVELRGEASLILAQPDGYDQDRLSAAALGAGIPVAPEMAVTAKLSVHQPGDGLDTIEAEAAFHARQRVGPQTALQAGGGGRFYRDDPGGGTTYHALWIEGFAAGQVQVAPRFAIDAHFRLSVPIADNYDVDGYPATAASFALRAVATLRRLDLYGGIGVASISTEYASRVLFVGVAGRLP